MNATYLDYLRHGEPLGGNRFRGNGVNDPLSPRGWEQMRGSVAGLDGWQRVVSSPMLRCADFATWLARERSLPLAVEPDLREVGFGSWEGVARKELAENRWGEYEAFYRDPVTNRPPGAESLAEFGNRVSRVFDRLLEHYDGERLLVVAHAGVIRATLGHVTRSPAIRWYRAEVDYAAITRFAHDRLGTRLVTHNWRPSL